MFVIIWFAWALNVQIVSKENHYKTESSNYSRRMVHEDFKKKSPQNQAKPLNVDQTFGCAITRVHP